MGRPKKKPSEKKDHQVCVRLDPLLAARLEKESKRLGVSLSDVVRMKLHEAWGSVR